MAKKYNNFRVGGSPHNVNEDVHYKNSEIPKDELNIIMDLLIDGAEETMH